MGRATKETERDVDERVLGRRRVFEPVRHSLVCLPCHSLALARDPRTRKEVVVASLCPSPIPLPSASHALLRFGPSLVPLHFDRRLTYFLLSRRYMVSLRLRQEAQPRSPRRARAGQRRLEGRG